MEGWFEVLLDSHRYQECCVALRMSSCTHQCPDIKQYKMQTFECFFSSIRSNQS